jgi:hypothetical protein
MNVPFQITAGAVAFLCGCRSWDELHGTGWVHRRYRCTKHAAGTGPAKDAAP